MLLSLSKIYTTFSPTIPSSPVDPILPIVISPIEGCKKKEPRDRNLQICATGRSRSSCARPARRTILSAPIVGNWCDKSWLDVAPSDIGKYRRQLKLKGLKAISINHLLKTLRSFYGWLPLDGRLGMPAVKRQGREPARAKSAPPQRRSSHRTSFARRTRIA